MEKFIKLVKEVYESKIYKGDDNYDYAFLYDEIIDAEKIKTLEDYANYKNDMKFIQYLTSLSIKTLTLLSLCTEFTDDVDKKENPKMYFEYEGWDELYFLEFELGTENVYQGYKAFNFDIELAKEIIKKEHDHEHSYTNCFWFICNTTIDKKDKKYDEEAEELAFEKRKSYMLGLTLDKYTQWKRNKLSYEPSKKDKTSDSLSLMLILSGLRREDIEKEPENSLNHLKQTFKL